MKKTVLIFLLITAIILPAGAQFTKIGAGAVIGTGYHFNNDKNSDLYRGPLVGIFATGIYEFKLPLHLVPSISYFIPRTNGDFSMKTKVSSLMIDLNAHYVFNSLDRFEFYALAGIDFQYTRLKWDETNSKEPDNVLGLNLGAGACLKLTETIDIFAEGKYTLSKYDQGIFNAGILLNLDWMIKHENDPE
jgi:opacity protein-like surface antigen